MYHCLPFIAVSVTTLLELNLGISFCVKKISFKSNFYYFFADKALSNKDGETNKVFKKLPLKRT